MNNQVAFRSTPFAPNSHFAPPDSPRGLAILQPIEASRAEIADPFPSAKELASWMDACPGNEERAGKILHQGIRYEERGPAVIEEADKVRARKMIRDLRTLGYHVEPLPARSSRPA